MCNRFDFIVAVVSLVGLVLQLVSSDFHVIALVRPLRVLRSVLRLYFPYFKLWLSSNFRTVAYLYTSILFVQFLASTIVM